MNCAGGGTTEIIGCVADCGIGGVVDCSAGCDTAAVVDCVTDCGSGGVVVSSAGVGFAHTSELSGESGSSAVPTSPIPVREASAILQQGLSTAVKRSYWLLVAMKAVHSQSSLQKKLPKRCVPRRM